MPNRTFNYFKDCSCLLQTDIRPPPVIVIVHTDMTCSEVTTRNHDIVSKPVSSATTVKGNEIVMLFEMKCYFKLWEITRIQGMECVHGGRNGAESLQVFVACIPCILSPMFELNTSKSEHNELLDSSWKIHNFNLRGLQTRGDWYSEFNPEVDTCSAIRQGGKKFIVVQSPLLLDENNDFAIAYFYATKSGIEQFMYPATADRSWMPHCGQRLQFRMATVALRRNKLVGLEALALPLDWYTWAASGWILSCLSAQYHGTPGILRLLPHFPILVIMCVVSFFLLGTVFYQGSMFSSLIARSPPDLPSNLKSVVDSKIQIITTSAFYETKSLLKYLMIDDVISTTNKSTKLFHTLAELKARTSFIVSLRRLYTSNPSGFIIGLNISEGRNLQFENEVSTRVMDTFAIINGELDLDETLAGVGVNRDPYVVRHVDSPIFFLEIPLENTRNFLLSAKLMTSNEQYRKIATARIFRGKKEMIFDEAEHVPLSALESIFMLCADELQNSNATYTPVAQWLLS
ncbi:hypothetical protein Fcan01_26540 [Folsomia candida]|uniref:Uncharacterized protein n=1 Tax=Folsomia candida TaxID=158441 RepID=A0A226D248_FOLCA|nr:hypothetical protein Fcan01_26540 [Folsomia candida]